MELNSNVKMCIQCGNYVEKHAKFCPHCGSSQKTHLTCAKCGENVPRDAKFCHTCGYTMAAVEQEQEQKQQTVNAGWRGVFYRFTSLLCWSCFLFVSAGALYQYSEGKWTDSHLAIIGVSALPLMTFITARWILRGAKKKVVR
ncbi:zinc ribbon domain-containing protein [Candidatus Uabimicrobium amorphum]|uniref:DZANK-type domain-containing protein n=1 Tax=Uabimicrobium amorphum TaxID=2596890 RepID=A0A5S9F199_UABAM|nr:zinc ribbon domain-containing protein [Candidatus Uabimicrobium amorphum]BBM82172.1 hypothetical protein UABAM_00515 [Candidatus Uabimicrobium amorphum]